MKENKRFYGFTEFRGKLAGRGREGRGPTNQITAGYGIPTYIPCGVLAQVRILENLIAHKYLPARASYRATELPNTAWQATTRL